MFLQVVLFARDVGRDFCAVRKADAGNFAKRRVGLFRGLGLDDGADAAALRAPLKGRNFVFLWKRFAPFTQELVNGWQSNHILSGRT